MKKQIFTIILLLMAGVTAFGQFKLDGGASSLRLQTGGVDRMYIAPNGVFAPVFPGNVGIGTITPDAKLTVNGDMAFKNIARFTTNVGYTATNRNGASVLIFEAGGVLNGIAGGVDGMLLYVLCGYKLPTTTTTGALVIKHEESINETVANNRIMTHTGADFTITTGVGGVMMVYDGGRQRWRIMEVTSGSGSFSGWGLTGNSGTNSNTQFIGTTDAQDLVFKVNNIERFNIDATTNGIYFKNLGLNPNFIGQRTNGTLANPLAIQNGNFLFAIGAEGYNGSSYKRTGSVDFIATEHWSTTANGTRIQFYTTQNGTQTASEKMRIQGNGDVGIGTTTPTAKLEVNGDLQLRGGLKLNTYVDNDHVGSNTFTYNALDLHDATFYRFGGLLDEHRINGIAGGEIGKIIYLVAHNGSIMNIRALNTNASPQFRIATPSLSDITCTAATLVYDEHNLWWVVSYH